MFIDFPEVDIAIQGIEEIKFPKMVKIRQNMMLQGSMIRRPGG